MLQALIRTFFRGVLALVLVASALVAYHLYRSGRFPYLQRAIEDAAVAGSIQAAYALHGELGRRPIEVESRNRRVVLSGAVLSEEEKSAAEELAGSVEGVEAIENRLVVEPELAVAEPDGRSLGEKIDDVALLAKVRTALRLDRETRGLDLELEVREGVVVVKGKLPSEEIRRRVSGRIGDVSGVAKVEDEMEVVPKKAEGS